MSEKKNRKIGIADAMRVGFFPRGIAMIGDEDWEPQVEAFLNHVRHVLERLRENSVEFRKGDAILEPRLMRPPEEHLPECPDDPHHYYCRFESVPNPHDPAGPPCSQKVCYNILGEKVCAGPVVCP